MGKNALASMKPLCLLVVLAFVQTVFASDKTAKSNTNVQVSFGSPTSTLLNINDISSWARNDGWNARDPFSGNAGLMYPRGKVAAVFQDGIWWGGKVFDGGSSIVRVGGQYYSIGTVGGRIVSRGVPADTSDRSVRIYRIRSDFRTADLTRDAAEVNRISIEDVTPSMVSAVRRQYEKDWNEWPWHQGAPFYDENKNGIMDPGESPGLANADQVIWYVANDLNVAQANSLFGSPPIGLEMQVTLWGYRTDQPPWSTTILKRVKLIYKGTASTPDTARIDSMFISQWSDPDLGDAGDDFVGCDTTLALEFVYNGRSSDVEYAKIHWPPPAVGYQFLQTPVVPGAPTDSAIINLRYVRGKKHVPFYSMLFEILPHEEPPNTPKPIYYFNWVTGRTFYTGRPYVHPRFPNDTTRFWFDGDPVTGTGRLDSIPGDKRMLASVGPFTMAPGDTQEVVIATMGTYWSSNTQSVWQLRRIAAAVRSDYQYLLEDLSANPDSTSPHVPSRFYLHENYPNPFNPSTTIRYEIGYKSKVLVRVRDILGREVSRLVDETKEGGVYDAVWNASGSASGVYFFSIEAGPFIQTKKGILLK